MSDFGPVGSSGGSGGNHEKKPWFNDGNKIAGAFTTLLFSCAGLIILALVIKLCLWIMGVSL